MLGSPGTDPTMKGALTLMTTKPGRVSARAPSQAMRRELVASLMRQNADNLLRQTPAEALTGPIVRGDAATVAAHLAAMTASERAVYQSWAKETLALAQARVPADTVARLQALLADN